MDVQGVIIPQRKEKRGGGILGQILGTAIGGLGGFVVGGPAGAATGASLGGMAGGASGEMIKPSQGPMASQGVNRLQSMVPKNFDVQLALLEDAKKQVMAAPDINPDQANEFVSFFSDAQNKIKSRIV